jgi:hypothetical protein
MPDHHAEHIRRLRHEIQQYLDRAAFAAEIESVSQLGLVRAVRPSDEDYQSRMAHLERRAKAAEDSLARLAQTSIRALDLILAHQEQLTAINADLGRSLSEVRESAAMELSTVVAANQRKEIEQENTIQLLCDEIAALRGKASKTKKPNKPTKEKASHVR